MWQARRIRNRIATAFLRREFGAWGDGSRLALPIDLVGSPRNVTVGRRVRIGPYLRVRASGRIVIGDECRLVGSNMLSTKSELVFGRSVLVAWGAQFIDEEHVAADPDAAIKDQGLVCTGPIRIGDGAWIGTNAVILGGVTIGRNAVVGANAVVRDDVPDHCTAVGVPAVVRSRREAAT
jgi:acetyltransferase-like isoleucine patch superfamily enzyme